MAGRRTVTVVPTSIWLTSRNSPPCSSVKDLASGNPSPVPSNLRLNRVSTCPKGAMARGMSSAAIPIPVSLTMNTNSPLGAASATSSMRPPSGVNFNAFEIRLIRICFSLVLSARSVGMLSGMRTSRLRLARSARGATRRHTDSIRSWGSTISSASNICPASILAVSRMSLISAKRCRALSEMSLV